MDGCDVREREVQMSELERCKAHFVSLQRWWDYGKVQIRQLCQEYTHGVTRDRARLVKELETTVVELQRLAVSTGEQGCLQSLKAQKSALASLLGSSAQGALVRSRHMDLTQMDVPSQFFFSLEKKNRQKRIIQSLRSDSGRLITDSAEWSFLSIFVVFAKVFLWITVRLCLGVFVARVPASGRGVTPGMAGDRGLEQLTRRHAVKLVTAASCSVEEAILSVEEAILAVEEAILSVEEAILSVEEAILSVEEAILSVEEAILSVEEAILSVEEAILSVEEAILSVEEAILSVEEAILAVEEAILSVEEAILSVEEAILSVEEAILSVEEAILSVEEAILAVEEAILSVEEAILSVEEAILSVGKEVGYVHINTEKVAEAVEKGATIQGLFTSVLPLVSPARRVIVSNAPPFIKNETLAAELSRFGAGDTD
uniref:Uncharacterized protein n=1 Tax=Knipowitschia caucasica TaxID=637954 RepID=A0AAV2L4H4_KNICA